MTTSALSLLDPDGTSDKPKRSNESRLRSPLRMAIVGCGAVTEKLHLPALVRLPGIRITALVDPDLSRVYGIAARLAPGLHTAASTTDLERYADAALVAVPNHLHTPIAADLLRRGLHVLVEKPLAVSLDEANRLIEVAQRAGRLLSVGLIRRHYLSFEFVQRVLEAGWLGRIQSFDCREGMAYAWSAASSSLYRPDHGGGVLVDRGAHVFDLLLAWLGPFSSVRYRDDARGGVEANSVLELQLRNGAKGIIELSWTRDLRNTCIIRGEKGEIEVGMFPSDPATLRLGRMQMAGMPTDGRTHAFDLHATAARQFEVFANAVRTGGAPPVSGDQALESIRLFEACRGARQALNLPWEPFQADVRWSEFAGKRVLVTGGAGFLGGRVVEALAQNSQANIRALVRDFSRVPSIAKYPVELIRGDVGDPEVLRRAMRGCDYVIHCAYGKGPRDEQFRVNVGAVKGLIQAARDSGVRQVVHVSTLMVYGDPKDGALNEEATSRPSRRDAYGYTKWKGEELALQEGKRLGVPVAVIQPAAVYGPDSPPWTWLPIKTMKSGRVVLVNGGNGISNAVYVDDVVTALLNAALEPRAAGERMLITGPDVVTWREFYGAFDELFGGGRTVSMSSDEIAQARRARKRGNAAQLLALIREEHAARRRLLALPAVAPFVSAVQTLLPAAVRRLKARVVALLEAPVSAAPATEEILLPSPAQERFFRAIVTVDCAKAARLIGYRPQYSFKSGMRLVGEWVRWANVL
jgi:predicted dehydrogenase/nucleoside-diphosphate-sugar epimerase